MRSVPEGADLMAQSARAIYWSAIIADFHRSALTHVEFCRRRHISIHSFRHWLYRRRPDLRLTPSDPATAPTVPGPAPSSGPQFLPVHIRPQPIPAAVMSRGTRSAPPLELVLADDRRIRVPSGFDPATLHQLLDTLERRP
jgi:hypothetical protein